MMRIFLAAIVSLSTVACTTSPPGRSVATPYPAGLWDAHVHLTVWGIDALDSLTKYGVVGVRDAGGDPALLKRWRSEIARGSRRGPRIFFSSRRYPSRSVPNLRRGWRGSQGSRSCRAPFNLQC